MQHNIPIESLQPLGEEITHAVEKCVHCGACLWNCTVETEEGSGQGNLVFRAGAGGLHSAVN